MVKIKKKHSVADIKTSIENNKNIFLPTSKEEFKSVETNS